MNTVTISPITTDGTRTEITFVQGGADRGSLIAKEWVVGAEKPTVTTYDVDTIRYSGRTLTCKAHVFFLSPDIQMIFSFEKPPYSLDVTISHSLFGDGTHMYEISEDDKVAMEKFLQTAAFPQEESPNE